MDFVGKKMELYGGMVSNLDGENIKAVFEIHGSQEKALEKAIKSSFDLIERFSLFNQVKELANPLSVRVGLEYGFVIINEVSTEKQSQINIFGETVTIASKIKDFAEKGQILIGPNLFKQVQDKFEFFPLEPVPVKGQKKPLSVFELKGKKKKEIKTDVPEGRMITSEMVGRQLKLEQIQGGFYNLTNGKGSVINIIGKAGIGKSRLMAEIRQTELVKDIALFEGRALSSGINLSFHPIIQIIKSWAGINEEDTTEEAKAKLESNINRINPEAFDEIFPFIATMMGYRLEGKAKERIKDIEGEALEKLILKNMRDILSRAATIRPFVIVIEDAHWCDISSIIFLESLFKLVQKQRILFINVLRPGHKETGERIRKFLQENLKEHLLEINIEPLTKDESDELIDNLLHKVELPDEINSLVIERASGNPFFIEEVIRSFIDEGLIEIKDDQFLLTENIKYANVPESIDNVILSRIDRLDGKTRELLKTASVIGRNFYFKVLEEAAQTIEEVDNKLEYLKDVQLINERKQKDEVEFLFKHALAQQATYDSIVEKSRKDLHLKIAGSIEKVFAGRIHEFYGTLAHHYSKAGQSEKTEEYLIKAADESMKSGASSEAVSFLKKALETHLQNTRNLPDRQKAVDLEEKLGFALYATGQFTEAVEYFEKVTCFYYKSFPKTDFQRKLSLAYSLFVMIRIIYFNRPKRERKRATIERKILLINDRKNRALVIIDPKRMFFEVIYGYRFFRHHKFGSYEASTAMGGHPLFFLTGTKVLYKLGQKGIETSLKYIDEQDVFGFICSATTRSVCSYYTEGAFNSKDEEEIFKQGIQIGEHWSVTTYYHHGGHCIIESGNQKLALYFIQRLKEVAEIFENSYSLVLSQRLEALYSLKFRNIENALNKTKDAISLSKKTNYTATIIALCCIRSIAFSLKSQPSEAKTTLSEAKNFLGDIKWPDLLSRYLIAKSYIEIAEFKMQNNSDGKIMLKTSNQLIKYAKKARKNLTEAYRLHAIVFWLLNKSSRAFKNFEKSIKAGITYDCKLELSRTYFEAGKFLRDPKNKKDRINSMNGAECLMKAKSMFEEMNLQWDLNEYENYMNGN